MQLQEEVVFSRPGEDKAQLQQSLLAEMKPALQQKVLGIQKSIHKDHQATILTCYRVGLELQEIRDDRADNQGKTYGLDSVRQVEQFFHWSRSYLTLAARLARSFTEAQIHEIIALASRCGEPVTLTHIRAVLPLEDYAEQLRLLREALDKEVTAYELDKVVQGERLPRDPAQKPAARRGRPLHAPRDFSGVLTQQEGYAEDFLERSLRVWEAPGKGLLARARELWREEVTDECLGKVKTLAGLLKEVARKAEDRAQEAEEVHQYLTGIVARNSKPAKPAKQLEALKMDKILPALKNYKLEVHPDEEDEDQEEELEEEEDEDQEEEDEDPDSDEDDPDLEDEESDEVEDEKALAKATS